jgi:hypothetical protein
MGIFDSILSALGLGGMANKVSDVASQAEQLRDAAAGVDDDDADDDADDDDSDADEGRDYDLEAKDDFARFDFNGDLAGWVEAKARVEHHWENEPKRDELFATYGIRGTQHWYQVQATFERWSESPAARAKYPTYGDLVQAMMTTQQRVSMELLNLGNQHEQLKADFEPVEGVTLEQWAKVQAGIAGGGDAAALVASLRIDQATWDRVSQEWNARMSRDHSATIAMEYSKHFQSAGVGQFAGAAAAAAGGAQLSEADAPIPLEKFVEIEVAQSTGVGQGKDAATILRSFGMSPMEWGQVGGWWSNYIANNAMKHDGALHRRYTALREQFDAKYATASADDDVAF